MEYEQTIASCSFVPFEVYLWTVGHTHTHKHTHTPVTITIKVITLALKFTLRVDMSHPDRNFPSECVWVRNCWWPSCIALTKTCHLISQLTHSFTSYVLFCRKVSCIAVATWTQKRLSFHYHFSLYGYQVNVNSVAHSAFCQRTHKFTSHHRPPSPFTIYPSPPPPPLMMENWGSLLLNMRWMFCVADIHSSHPF